jgi:hypothetical protein
MKVIQINTIVGLTSGIDIPSGSIVTIAEGYADVKSTQEGLIPSQVATFLFASAEAMLSGKAAIQGIEDFNPVFSDLKLTIVDFQTKPAETLLIDAVYSQLVIVYGESNVEIVTI